MVDSGVDLTHASLSGARITVVDVIRNKDNAPGEAHGTAIAGIMLGRNALAGIAPQAQLLAIRAFRQIGSGSSAAQSSSYYVAKGISRAVDAQVQVINLSLTGPQDRLVTQSVEQALLGRIAVVAAAGNAGPGAPPAYPAAQPGVIAVTATDGRDRLYKHANRGSYVTLAAPGVDILCAAPGNAYDYLSGTSMASAYVSGLTALMLDRQSGLGPSQIRQILEATATDLGPPQRDQQFGAGRIDAAAAFSQLAGN
jgi:subtilisin family serine protease